MNETTDRDNLKRGYWDEIVLTSLDPDIGKTVKSLVNRAAASADEHGSWDFGARFDKRGRGEALNWDLYSYGYDVHTQQLLAVIQVRQARVGKRWTNVRKNYFLLGENEDGTVFSHSISAHVVRSAINRDVDVIRAVQDWIFDCDYNTAVRQGDVVLVPAKRVNAEPTSQKEIILEDTHYLIAEELRLNGNLYALNPTLLHLNGTHRPVSARGWFKVRVGKRAPCWKFAQPSPD